MQYNFVVFGEDWDLYQCAFSDLNKLKNAIYISGNKPPKKTLKGFFYRLHFRPELNRKKKMPFLKIWNNFYFQKQFNDNKPICFIFLATFASYAKETDFIPYLRRKYDGCKIVLFKTDLITKSKNVFTGVPLPIEYFKENFDLIISYDKGDCKRYGFKYYPTIFSQIELTNSTVSSCDVYFAAKYKGRLPVLITIYDQLTNAGLKCDFYIYGAPLATQIKRKGIHYIEKMMSYTENLSHSAKAKCLLEIMQNDADGYTYRTWESLSYNKLFITNNQHISTAPFYNEKFMQIITESNNYYIPESFIIKIQKDLFVDYNYRQQMSPIKLLEFIENFFIVNNESNI